MGHNTDTKALLWKNVEALMTLTYGEERLSQFARDCGIGAATMTRLKQQETSVGIDVLEKIAAKFKLHPWQLISEDLGASLYVIDAERRIVPVFPAAAPVAPSRKRQDRAA